MFNIIYDNTFKIKYAKIHLAKQVQDIHVEYYYKTLKFKKKKLKN